MRAVAIVGTALCWATGVALLVAACYIRCFVISDDAFDPWRETSVSMMFGSSLSFLVSVIPLRLYR
jgi:hypothetical protein